MSAKKGGGGSILLAIGGIGAVLAMSMDTSVSTGFGRVNNIGLMRDQQNYLMISAVIAIIGVILMVRDSSRANPTVDKSAALKKCPDCTEMIKADAVVCRFCGNRNLDGAEAVTPECQSGPREYTLWERLWWKPED